MNPFIIPPAPPAKKGWEVEVIVMEKKEMEKKESYFEGYRDALVDILIGATETTWKEAWERASSKIKREELIKSIPRIISKERVEKILTEKIIEIPVDKVQYLERIRNLFPEVRYESDKKIIELVLKKLVEMKKEELKGKRRLGIFKKRLRLR